MQNADFEYGFGSSALTALEPEPVQPDPPKRKVPANRKQAKQQEPGDGNNAATEVRFQPQLFSTFSKLILILVTWFCSYAMLPQRYRYLNLPIIILFT